MAILGAPLLVGLLEDDPEPVPERRPVVSKIDVLIVSEEPPPAAPRDLPFGDAPGDLAGGYAHPSGFEVSYAVGFATGEDGIRWTRTGTDAEGAVEALGDPGGAAQAPPEPVHDADRIVLLLVDATPAVVEAPADLPSRAGVAGEVRRWRRIARAAAPGGTPTFALLETRSRARLGSWDEFIQRGTHVRRGGAVSIQRFGRGSVAEAAVDLAIGSPSSQEEFVLALRHQPILRFHSTEPVPRPLSVGWLFDTGRVKQCFSRRVGGEECVAVKGGGDLENGGTNLELRLPRGRALEEAGTAMYVHPVPVESEDASTLFLDYWWYLPDNPTGSGGGAFCGPGLVIPGISCFDHESDWEGVTVALDRTNPRRVPRPVSVRYAQHGDVVRYRWEELAPRPGAAIPRARGCEPPPRAAPRVRSCSSPAGRMPAIRCRVRALGPAAQVATDLTEQPHDGRPDWVGNALPACERSTCLRLLADRARRARAGALERVRGPLGRAPLLHDLLLRLRVATGSAGAPGSLQAPLGGRRHSPAGGTSREEIGGDVIADLHCHYPMHVMMDEPQDRLRAMTRVRGRPLGDKLRAVVLRIASALFSDRDHWSGERVNLDYLNRGDVRLVFSVLHSPFSEMDLSRRYGSPTGQLLLRGTGPADRPGRGGPGRRRQRGHAREGRGPAGSGARDRRDRDGPLPRGRR